MTDNLSTDGNADSYYDYGTDDFNASNLTFNRWAIAEGTEVVAVPIVFGIIFVVGLVGNGILIFSVLANKVMRNVPNILIVSLSMGDFLLILISVPLTSTIFTFSSWPYGTVVCKLNEFLHTTSLGISIFSLMALSADRYVAIVDPMAKLTGRTTRTTIVLAAGIWLFSVACAIPDAIFSTVVTHRYKEQLLQICSPYPLELELAYPPIYTVVRFLVFFVIPIHTIGVFYIIMSRILIRSSQSVPMEVKSGAANNCRQIAARKRVAYVVLSFVVLFVICWFPRHVYLMWHNFGESDYDEYWHAFKITGFCLKFMNSCINPIACYFLSGQFRKYYNRYLFCCCRWRRYTSLETRGYMHNLNSTTRRGSPTSMSVVHTQSAF